MADYSYWQNALQGRFGDVHDDDPQPGFYRTKDGLPVAIWEQDGTVVGTSNGAWINDLGRIWTHVCQRPVTEDAYHARMEGKPWPDVDQAVHDARHGIGGNQPDDRAAIQDQIESALAGTAAYDKIGDDETAARAQSLRARLNELAGQAEKQREAEKRPHLEAGKAVDAKWKPLVDRAKIAAQALASAMGKWETAKFQAEQQRLRELENARRKAEAENAPPPPPPAPTAPAPAQQVRGGYGRAASVKTVKVIQAVTNWDDLFLFYRSRPEVRDLVRKLADKDVADGLHVPGVEIVDERKVR